MLWLKAARERLKKFKFQLTAEGPEKKPTEPIAEPA